jgi:molecular chaperone HscA
MQICEIEEPKKNKEIVVGIDFGTTNSLVGYVDSGISYVLSDEHNRRKIPSIIAITENAEVIVGTKAAGLVNKKGTVVIKSIKRLIGKKYQDIAPDNHLKKFIFDKENGNIYFVINGHQFSVIELVSEVFKKIRSLIDVLGKSIVNAVVTVPAYFDEVQRRVVKSAADMAGINVIRIINEPTAAALAYRLDKIKLGTYLVYDFGGGTFDVSILKITEGIVRVIATGGDSNLGGDDIDFIVAKYLSDKFGCNDEVTKWLETAREVKEALSSSGSTIVEQESKKITVTSQDLDFLTQEIIKKTIRILQDTIERSGVSEKDIDGIILAGGSTRIKLVEQKLAMLLPGKSFLKSIDPDEVVAIGSATQAHNLSTNTGDLLLDVTPLSLGLELMGGINEKIIYRNSTIPISVSKTFTTHEDGQTGLKLHIVQGESDLISNCMSLAKVDLFGIPPMRAGDPRIKVTFTMDSEGLLTVTAQESSTGASQFIEVVPTYGLTAERVKESILMSTNDVKDMIIEKKLADSRIYAKEVTSRFAEAIKEDNDLLTEDEYAKIYSHIDRVNHLVVSGRSEEIDKAVNELEESASKFNSLKRNKSIKVGLKK